MKSAEAGALATSDVLKRATAASIRDRLDVPSGRMAQLAVLG